MSQRMSFHSMCMQPGEEFDPFLGRLCVQGRRCGFSVMELERELRGRCVAGSSDKLREKLLLKAAEKGGELTLTDIRKTARVYQDVRQLGSMIQAGAGAAQVQAINHQMPSKSANGKMMLGDCKPVGGPVSGFRGKCFKCGQVGHMRAQCGSIKSRMTCFQCGRPGHRKRDCGRNKTFERGGQGGGQGRQVADQTQCMLSVEPDGLWNVQARGSVGVAPTAQLSVNGTNMEFVVDTGSPVTIVSDQTLIPALKLRPCQLTLASFTGQQLPLAGEADVNVELRGQQKTLRLVVSRLSPHKPLMGREWIAPFQIKPQAQVKNCLGNCR